MSFYPEVVGRRCACDSLRMEAAGDKAQRQIWSATDVKKLNCAVERAQGTAGVNWDSVSMELGRCDRHI